MNTFPSRRDVLKTIAGAAAASFLDLPTLQGAPKKAPQPFRFVHLTDTHVQHERDGDKGFAKSLKAVEALEPKPDFILTGGDLVFDVLDVPPERATMLFDLYKKVIADNTSLPVYNTIGNHDVFGWHPQSGISPKTAGYGKALVKDKLQLNETYHAFEHKGWRFFCLDNILPGGDERYPYLGGLDPVQFDWFKSELQKTDPKTPIVTCEHIPLITVTGFAHDNLHEDKHWHFNDALVCGDAAQRLPLLRTRNVRLALSGHIHERDRVEYWDTTFINDGAVCGSWWKGPHRGVPEGFGVFDLRTDGSFDYRYHEYGWKAQPE
jgi:3',5'-cyclic-AMP phosphodiesterase